MMGHLLSKARTGRDWTRGQSSGHTRPPRMAVCMVQADSLPSEPSGKPKEQYTKPMFFRQHKMKQEGQ